MKYYIALGSAFNNAYYDQEKITDEILSDTDLLIWDSEHDKVDDLLAQAMGNSEFVMLTRETYWTLYSKQNGGRAVISSQGVFWITPQGDIGKKDLHPDEDSAHYWNIVKFDIAEWKTYYGKKSLPLSLDILDLGYTFADGTYEGPAMDWREEVKIMREGGEV